LSQGIDLKARKNTGNNKRESLESDTHREYVHRLSVGSPTSPSQKLFLHSLRERNLDDEENSFGRQHQHIEHHQKNKRQGGGIVNGDQEVFPAVLDSQPSLLGTSWDSAFAKKLEKKRHYTTRRTTVNDRRDNNNITERIVVVSASIPSSSIKLASSATTSRPGDQQEQQQQEQDDEEQQPGQTHSRQRIGHSTGTSSRSSIRHQGRSRKSERSKQSNNYNDSAAARTTKGVLEGNTTEARGARVVVDEDDLEAGQQQRRGRSDSSSHPTASASVQPSSQSRHDQRREHQQPHALESDDDDEYDDEDEDEEGYSSSSDDDNSAIEDLMSQIKMSECPLLLSCCPVLPCFPLCWLSLSNGWPARCCLFMRVEEQQGGHGIRWTDNHTHLHSVCSC